MKVRKEKETKKKRMGKERKRSGKETKRTLSHWATISSLLFYLRSGQ